jgi:hypothetical protein
LVFLKETDCIRRYTGEERTVRENIKHANLNNMNMDAEISHHSPKS